MTVAFWIPNRTFAGIDDGLLSGPNVPPRVPRMSPALARYESGAMRHYSPRYDVTEDEKHFRIAIDVPGVKPDNMKVELEDEGRVLRVSGSRKTKRDGSCQEYEFNRRFALGKELEASKITAHLSEGVLVLTAPKKEKPPAMKREIPIVREDAPVLMTEEENKEE